MRAIVLKGVALEEGQTLEVRGDQAFHLIRVVRIEVEEKVLILNGEGIKAWGTVLELKKKLLTIKVDNIERGIPLRPIDLAFGIPKREAFEELVRQSVELGYARLFPLLTHYSQNIAVRGERLDRLLESGLEQSNNPYAPVMQETLPIANLPFKDYDSILFYTSEETSALFPDLNSVKVSGRVLVVVGPEGGWSVDEIQMMLSLKETHHVLPIRLNCPILRTPTAAAVAMGQVLSLFY